MESSNARYTCVTRRGRGLNRAEIPSVAVAANIVTVPQWSRLFGGLVQTHCPTRVKNDENVEGTRITNTGLHVMGGILCTCGKI